ncbi:ribonuclease R [Sphaerotilus mobilis]|uniref:Ribonuclease R n=1 Tax=Sphaerotilus mobilis TaxID=47994 RepID=A0A4Q7LUS8_9BURK|nr:ribonuclease R [Sphaerotilus mobilis]RZS58644.1 RNAse R [Sphaerotilus mobilis]
MSEIEGTVQGHRDGHGFVIREDGEPDIYLAPQEMRAVLHRDRVKVRVIRLDRKGRPEGRVLEIVERKRAPIIGRLLLEGGAWIVAPEDKRYGQDILIPKNATAKAEAGQVVAIELTEPPSLYSQPVGRITEVLGDIDDPGMEIEIAVRKYEVPHNFSTETLAQTAKLPDRLRAIDLKGRVDLRDVPLVTIDGEDARDFDDAVYCEPAKIGRAKGWRLLVAIADVSHYVKPGEALDGDAFERATSVYFPRRVIPMLPEKLSNGLCSLNPDQERLTMVCDMLVDATGEVVAYQFYPAVILSHARFTYNEVAAILANTRGPEARKRAARVNDLINLHEVYRALLKQRAIRGAVDFETTETQIVCDDNGRIEKIVPRTRTEAHRLIEESMLAANVCAADFIHAAKHPCLFRVHEGPTPEKRQTLQNYLRSMGLGFVLSEDPKPSELQMIAQQTRDRPDAAQIHQMLLRAMQQAIYTPINSGHFGLAYEAYTHFTSPIRRYPDLLVHRVIKAILAGKKYTIDLPRPPNTGSDRRGLAQAAKNAKAAREQESHAHLKPAKAGAAKSQAQAVWESAGIHCSANERRADEASRDVEAWLKCKFMRDRLGEEYIGTISAVTSFGLFVQLNDLYVEGLVHITELGGEYYRYDEVRQELRGERTGVRYAVGGRIQVQVSRVDLDGRKIDFRLVREGGAAAPGASQRSPRERTPKTGNAQAELANVQETDREVRKAARKAASSATRKTRPPKVAKPGKGKATSAGKGASAATGDGSAVTRSAKPRRSRT